MTKQVTLSMEIELGWGTHDQGTWDTLSRNREAEELFLEKLLSKCDKFGIPITFDVVGHLLLEHCDGHDGPHRNDWFKNDPQTNELTDPLFYWPSVVDKINNRSTDHEICTHTFSHVLCDEISDEVFYWEIDKARELHNVKNIGDFSSFVPPRHKSPRNELLRENDVDIVRKPKKNKCTKKHLKYLRRIKDWVFNTRHPEYPPQEVDGVVETYTTPYPSLTAVHLPAGQREPLAPFKSVPVSVRQDAHLKYLKRSVNHSHGYIHLWTHLLNLSNNYQWGVVNRFLEFLGKEQKQSDIEIITMEQLAEHVRENE